MKNGTNKLKMISEKSGGLTPNKGKINKNIGKKILESIEPIET